MPGCAPLPARTLSAHAHAHRRDSRQLAKRSSKAPCQCHRSRFSYPHSCSQPAMDPDPSVNEPADAPPFTPEQLNWIDQLITSRQSQSLPSTDSELPESSSASRVPTSAAPHALTTAASQPGKCVIGLVHLVLPAISE